MGRSGVKGLNLHQDPSEPSAAAEPPIFNIPRIVVWCLAILVGVHVLRVFLLTPGADTWVVLTFAFIPARYGGPYAAAGWPGGFLADVWTFVTYGFLHGDITHLTLNCIWLAAFGSAVARRVGAERFLILVVVATIAGALAHLAARWGDMVPVIGASGGISGLMGAAIRFAFGRSRIGAPGYGAEALNRRPALPLRDLLRLRNVIVFLAVWFSANIMLGLGLAAGPGMQGGGVAWEAHIGGFLAGFIVFPWIDRRSGRPAET